MLIDNTYFQQGELYIPNSRDMNASVTGGTNVAKIQVFIDRYERDLLINALGVVLYNQLKTILDADTLNDVGNEKWEKLVNGEDYTLDGKTYRFDGLLGFSQQSFVASYVYCRYLKDNDATYTTVGTVRDTAKNATSVSAAPKYVGVWNSFIEKYQGNHGNQAFLDDPVIIRNTVGEIGLDWFAGEEGIFRSMYQYMTDKNEVDETNFPDFQFTFYHDKNSLGI